MPLAAAFTEPSGEIAVISIASGVLTPMGPPLKSMAPVFSTLPPTIPLASLTALAAANAYALLGFKGAKQAASSALITFPAIYSSYIDGAGGDKPTIMRVYPPILK
jgi:hypothetical protein